MLSGLLTLAGPVLAPGALEPALWPALLFLGGTTAAATASLLPAGGLVLLLTSLLVLCPSLVVTACLVGHGE